VIRELDELPEAEDHGVTLMPPEWPPKPGLFRRLLGLVGLGLLLGLLTIGCVPPDYVPPKATPTAISVPITAAAGTPCAPDWTAIMVILGAIVAIGFLCWFGVIVQELVSGQGWQKAKEREYELGASQTELERVRTTADKRVGELEYDNQRLREELEFLRQVTPKSQQPN
jgi:hypothetical protein